MTVLDQIRASNNLSTRRPEAAELAATTIRFSVNVSYPSHCNPHSIFGIATCFAQSPSFGSQSQITQDLNF